MVKEEIIAIEKFRLEFYTQFKKQFSYKFNNKFMLPLIEIEEVMDDIIKELDVKNEIKTIHAKGKVTCEKAMYRHCFMYACMKEGYKRTDIAEYLNLLNHSSITYGIAETIKLTSDGRTNLHEPLMVLINKKLIDGIRKKKEIYQFITPDKIL